MASEVGARAGAARIATGPVSAADTPLGFRRQTSDSRGTAFPARVLRRRAEGGGPGAYAVR
jgi:hypothetical protein